MTTDEPQTPDPVEEIEMEVATEAPEAGEVGELEEATPVEKPMSRFHSVRNLWIAIAGLTFLLIVSMVFSRKPDSRAVAPDDPELAAMRADLETRRAELNRQRAELNLPPLIGQGEDAGEITARLRRDAETLISLMERYQQLVVEKDRALTEKNVELIRSEQVRESLTAELARAQVNTSGSARLQNELSDALARASRLADELADARRQIAELSKATSEDELELLGRRLEEVVRTRDFYQQRVRELEAAIDRRDASRDAGGE